MSDSQSVGSRPVCPFFAKRQCAWGRHCRYLHVVTIDRDIPHQENVSSVEDYNTVTELNKTSDQVQSTLARNQRDDHDQKSICNHFLRTGWCRFGRTCRYSHIIPQSQKVAPPAAAEFQNYNVGTNSASAAVEPVSFDASQKGESENASLQEMAVPTSSGKNWTMSYDKVCKFYRAGYCRMGSRCHFRHTRFQHKEHPRSRKSNESHFRDGANSPSDFKSIHSETSSDSGLVEDFIPRRKGASIKAISELDEARADEHNRQNRFNSKETTVEETLKNLRKTEIQQLHKRYCNAKEIESTDEQTTIQFVFLPTDPDWPYDIKEMTLQVVFPQGYPSEMMNITMVEDERIPNTVRKLVTEDIQNWVTLRFRTMKADGKNDLAFRPFLRWFDKNAEDLFTEALKQFRRERMAEIAGVQFISADELKSKYKPSSSEDKEEGEDENQKRSDIDNETDAAQNQEKKGSDTNNEQLSTTEEKENSLSQENSTSDSTNPSRRGTEVMLQNLQLLNCAATLMASSVSLMISCGRCSNKSELKTKVGQLSRVECPYCRNEQLVMFRENIAHQFSSVVGYLDLEGCEAFDMILSDSGFIVNCLECAKDNKLEALPPGQLNNTWCLQCHSKLTVAANSVRFVKLSAVALTNAGNACTVEVKGRVKTVKDPAIVEGKPLPNNGRCRHFKKSFRWFRFPCCGKAYPCDHCHDENEKGHEMKRANRIICGFCAKEQPCVVDRSCIGCNANITNRSTDHWEGGTGCRDKVRMSRGDSKKYADTLKISSRSSQNKKEPGKKVVKLRHV